MTGWEPAGEESLGTKPKQWLRSPTGDRWLWKEATFNHDAAWLPDQDICRYIGAWVAVKARWGLAVDAEEATALSDLLVGECAGTTVAPWPPAPR